MSKDFDKLDQVFNIRGEIVSDNTDIIPKTNDLDEKVDVQYDTNDQDLKKDYEYVRGNMYSIVEKGQEALDNVLQLAQESESPRAYEVVGQILKNVSDSAEKIIDLHKKIKELDEKDNIKGPTNVTNALFVGSTSELSKMIKEKLNNEKNK